MSIYFGGSRSLSPASAPLVSVVSAVLASGATVSVGCSAGADQLVIRAVLSAGCASRLVVRAAFAASGAGAWRCSAVSAVRAAAAAGASVSWLAGGALSVPLVARLMSRSIAGLSGASACVFFQPGPGSLAVAGVAAARGLPVFAFSLAAPAAPRGCAGSWSRSSFFGFACWRWVSAQLPLF